MSKKRRHKDVFESSDEEVPDAEIMPITHRTRQFGFHPSILFPKLTHIPNQSDKRHLISSMYPLLQEGSNWLWPGNDKIRSKISRLPPEILGEIGSYLNPDELRIKTQRKFLFDYGNFTLKSMIHTREYYDTEDFSNYPSSRGEYNDKIVKRVKDKFDKEFDFNDKQEYDMNLHEVYYNEGFSGITNPNRYAVMKKRLEDWLPNLKKQLDNSLSEKADPLNSWYAEDTDVTNPEEFLTMLRAIDIDISDQINEIEGVKRLLSKYYTDPNVARNALTFTNSSSDPH